MILFFIIILPFLAAALALPWHQQALQDEYGQPECSASLDVADVINISPPAPQRIAIIGSGIVGAAAAFSLEENSRQNSKAPPLTITILEQNSVVGGRITATRIFDEPELTIDTCAATFNGLSDTCILGLASNIGLMSTLVTGLDNGTAVWNGEEVVGFIEDNGFRDMTGSPNFKQARFRVRYGEAPFSIVRSRIETFYRAGSTAVTSGRKALQDLIGSGQIKDVLTRGACEGRNSLCDGSAESELYLREVIEAGIRDRFFGDTDELNELNAVLGLSSETNLQSIAGGNVRLIDRLIKVSGARVALNTKVLSVERTNSGSWNVFVSQGAQKGITAEFDKVIIAAPISLAGLTISPNPPALPQVEYVDTVVTHFTSGRELNPDYFGTGLPVPQNILTSATATKAGNKAKLPFFSLRLLDRNIRPLNRTTNGPAQKLYKIVSSQSIPDSTILQYLESDNNDNRGTPAITWINREYLPKSVPRLDRALKLQGSFEIQPGLFYAGGGGQITDTIEFGCRVGTNAAQLIVPRPIRGNPGNG